MLSNISVSSNSSNDPNVIWRFMVAHYEAICTNMLGQQG